VIGLVLLAFGFALQIDLEEGKAAQAAVFGDELRSRGTEPASGEFVRMA
jgi:hypothetical protein